MLTIKQFFTAAGLSHPHERIKLVRHVNHPAKAIEQMIEAREFEFYQSEQKAARKPFHGCDVIIAFVPAADGGSTFHGVYKVHDCRPLVAMDRATAPAFLKASLKGATDRILYRLEELPQFNALRGRLRPQWSSPLAWVQKRDMEIAELLPVGRVKFFPGYQDVILSWKELRAIWAEPKAHSDWLAALKFTAAIYRIVDQKTGLIYIGSAYGKTGLWKRWNDYAQTGDGGNVALKGLDPAHFQWSIVRTLSGVMCERDVIRIEYLEKRKHGKGAVALSDTELAKA